MTIGTKSNWRSLTRETYNLLYLWEGRHWTATLQFELADFWVGVYWESAARGYGYDVWLCLFPTLPLYITIGAPHHLQKCPSCGEIVWVPGLGRSRAKTERHEPCGRVFAHSVPGHVEGETR
jgi:hypothetical protein